MLAGRMMPASEIITSAIRVELEIPAAAASTTRRTSSGRRSARRSATTPPSECPRTSTWSSPSSSQMPARTSANPASDGVGRQR